MAAPCMDCYLGDGSDAEDEEEEQLVMVELTGIIDSDMLEKCENKCKIVGINTDKPFLQVDKYVFVGEYEDALGTCVIFEETSDQVDSDNTKPQLKYKCHTMKKLNMTRTFLSEKKESDDAEGKVEWFQINDDSFANVSEMICTFAQEHDEGDDTPSEEDEEQLDGSNEHSGHLDQSSEMEKQDSEGEEKQDIEVKEKQDSQGAEKQDPEHKGASEGGESQGLENSSGKSSSPALSTQDDRDVSNPGGESSSADQKDLGAECTGPI
ncbi:general transcription factor 3C polypeptide 6-like [Discoglossus pictus]